MLVKSNICNISVYKERLKNPIYLLESDTSTYTIKIAGTTKNVYTVIYKPDLTCNCPDAKKDNTYVSIYVCNLQNMQNSG